MPVTHLARDPKARLRSTGRRAAMLGGFVVLLAMAVAFGARGCEESTPVPKALVVAKRVDQPALPSDEDAAEAEPDDAPVDARAVGEPAAPDSPRTPSEAVAAHESSGRIHRAHRRRSRDAADASANDASSQDAPRRKRHGVVFESEKDTAYATPTPQEIPDLGGLSGRGTVAFWLDPQWGAGNQDDASLIRIGGDLLQVEKNVTFLRFEFLGSDGVVDGVGAPIGDWGPGEWHHIAATWDAGVLTLYIDGNQVSQKAFVGQIELPPDAKLQIGSMFPPGRPIAPGVLAGVEVRSRPLSPLAIGRLFEQGQH